MEGEKKKESPLTRMRMTCLMWVAILVFIVLFARFCVLLIKKT